MIIYLPYFYLQIRDETQTRINLPTEGEKSDVITIMGKKENVEEAKRRIQEIQNEQVCSLLNILNDRIWISSLRYKGVIGLTL